MQVIKSFLNDFLYKKSKPKKAEWVLLGLLFLFPFLCYFYGDTTAIVLYEMNFMGSIVRGGGLQNYYEYTKYLVESTGPNHGGCYATYDFPMYFIMGIWGIPLWFVFGARDIEFFLSFWGKVYGKSIYIVALIICTYLIYRICLQLKISKDDSKWGAFLFASSIFVFTAVAINGQSDIIGIVFILLGIYSYVKQNRKAFLLWFMIAACFKMYALFIFLPLLLLIEKNVIRIGMDGIIVLLMKLGLGIVFDPNSEAMHIKNAFEYEMFERLLNNKLPLINGDVPITLVLIFGICVFCYLHEEIKDSEMLHRYAIYVPMLTMICLFISFESSSYWYLHMSPYLAIMLAYNTKNLKNNMLFETFGLICITFYFYATRPWAFDVDGSVGMLLEILIRKYDTIHQPLMLEELCDKLHITDFSGVLNAVFVVAVLTLCWMNRPKEITYEEKCNIRPWAIMRLGVNGLVGGLPILLIIYNMLCRP